MGGRERSVAGFTVIEVSLALAIGGLVLLMARAILLQVTDTAELLTSRAEEMDREANAERWLRRTLIQVRASGLSAPSVEGDPRSVRLDTWCDVVDGWQRPCQVGLAFGAEGDSLVLSATVDEVEGPVVLRGFESGELLYLVSGSDGGLWIRNWTGTLSVPLALGIAMDGDTLILRTGLRP